VGREGKRDMEVRKGSHPTFLNVLILLLYVELGYLLIGDTFDFL